MQAIEDIICETLAIKEMKKLLRWFLELTQQFNSG